MRLLWIEYYSVYEWLKMIVKNIAYKFILTSTAWEILVVGLLLCGQNGAEILYIMGSGLVCWISIWIWIFFLDPPDPSLLGHLTSLQFK